MGWTALYAKDYNYTVRRPRFQLAYKLLSGVQFATILCTLANVVYLLIKKKTTVFFCSLFYSITPCYRFYQHHRWYDLVMVLLVTALITFCSVNSLRETIGKTDQSILIPIKYLFINLLAIFVTSFFTLSQEFETICYFTYTDTAFVFSGYIFYIISAIAVIVLKCIEHWDYYGGGTVEYDPEYPKHPTWNFATYGRKVLIIYALEVFFFLLSLIFIYYTYTDKVFFFILPQIYIFVTAFLACFLFAYAYSLKLYLDRAYEPAPPKGVFKKKFLHALISIGVFALTFVPIMIIYNLL